MSGFMPTRRREHISADAPGVRELLQMLTYRRPAWSNTEEAFIKRFIVPTGALPDEFGNYWLTIGDSCPILWSSHTDTVHKTKGNQKVLYGLNVASTEESNCLGADDTAGVWLMIQMIRAGVPGTYVFHRGEEIGGLGSEYIAKHTPERLHGIEFAIAFDRKGTTDVITHQYSRTCSDRFAAEFVRCLPTMGLSPCSEGIFTDTQNYAHLIAECTNVAVGYFDAHRSTEWLDVGFLTDLRDAVLAADFTGLTAHRDPMVDDDDLGPIPIRRDRIWDDAPVASREMDDFVYENPSDVADFLTECGYDVDDLLRYVTGRRGSRRGSAL